MLLFYFQTEDHDPDSEHERSSLGNMARQCACRTTAALGTLVRPAIPSQHHDVRLRRTA